MAGEQLYSLQWYNFGSNIVDCFKHLRTQSSFADVTLACDGQTCKAHKMVLSACSPYFKSLLDENKSKHPIIILKDVNFEHLEWIIEFMYTGEATVPLDKLPAFLKTAEKLKVKGLTEVKPGSKVEQAPTVATMEQEPASSTIAQMKQEPSRPTIAQMKQEPSRPTIAQMKEEPARPTIAQMKEEPASSTIAQMKQEPVSPTIAQMKQEPVSPTIAQMKQEPVSPTIAQMKQEPLSPTIAQMKQEPVSPTIAQMKQE